MVCPNLFPSLSKAAHEVTLLLQSNCSCHNLLSLGIGFVGKTLVQLVGRLPLWACLHTFWWPEQTVAPTASLRQKPIHKHGSNAVWGGFELIDRIGASLYINTLPKVMPMYNSQRTILWLLYMAILSSFFYFCMPGRPRETMCLLLIPGTRFIFTRVRHKVFFPKLFSPPKCITVKRPYRLFLVKH